MYVRNLRSRMCDTVHARGTTGARAGVTVTVTQRLRGVTLNGREGYGMRLRGLSSVRGLGMPCALSLSVASQWVTTASRPVGTRYRYPRCRLPGYPTTPRLATSCKQRQGRPYPWERSTCLRPPKVRLYGYSQRRNRSCVRACSIVRKQSDASLSRPDGAHAASVARSGRV
jgi:hypothetical protein